jgi:hypothetical protein
LATAAADDPSQQALASLVQELQVVQIKPALIQLAPSRIAQRATLDEQVGQMRAARQAAAHAVQAPLQKTFREPLFSDAQKLGINRLSDQVTAEQTRLRLEEERRIQEERRRQEEAERQRREQEEERKRLIEKINLALSASRGRTFSSHQDARRFFMSLVAGLPDELLRSLTSSGLRWRCYAYGCEHSSPDQCADPSQGGVWLLP